MDYGIRVLLSLVCCLMIASCSHSEKKQESKKGQVVQTDEQPLKLHIGDGRVFIEKSHSHDLAKGRKTAATRHNNNFMATEKNFPGKAWIEVGTPYELDPSKQASCKVVVKKSHFDLGDKGKLPSYSVKVDIIDGIKQGPFEVVINGENEGEIQFGDYPVATWKSAENLRLDETFISRWSYNAKDRRYKIVKKMGEDEFLSKEVRIDHQLRDVASVKYEILKGEEGQDPEEMVVQARFSCGL